MMHARATLLASSFVISLAASVTFGGCTLVGYVAGSIADSGKRDTVSIFDDIDSHIGTVVKLRYSDDSDDYEFATFKGYEPESDSSYAIRYAEFLESDSASAPLEPGEAITVFLNETPLPKVGPFGGFLPASIAIGHGDVVAYSEIHHLESPLLRRPLSGAELQWMVLNNRLPIKEVLHFSQDSESFSMFNDEAETFDALVASHTARSSLTTIGLAVDLAIIEALVQLAAAP